MDRSIGIEIPETLEEICAPSRAALLVYDLQAGIVSQIPGGDRVIEHVARLVRSARAAGVRIVYSRYYNVPLAWAGVGQLRMEVPCAHAPDRHAFEYAGAVERLAIDEGLRF